MGGRGWIGVRLDGGVDWAEIAELCQDAYRVIARAAGRPSRPLVLSGPSGAEYWGRWVSRPGALVCGRTLFDFTDGWGGRHTMDVPVVVVTHQVPAGWVKAHPGAPFHFVTGGVEAAVARAQEIAGDRIVAVAAGTVAGQCLELGLLDEVAVDLVPVVMGDRGARSLGRSRWRTSRSATQPSACRETGSPIWVFPAGTPDN